MGNTKKMTISNSPNPSIYADTSPLGTDRIIIGVALGSLFGLFAIIPWIIVAQMGWFVSFLGYLIAIAILKGFEIGAGRSSKIAQILVFVLVLLYIPLAQLIGEVIYGVQYGFTILETLDIIFNNFGEYIGEMFMGIIMGYVFAFLGAFNIIRGKQQVKVETPK